MQQLCNGLGDDVFQITILILTTSSVVDIEVDFFSNGIRADLLRIGIEFRAIEIYKDLQRLLCCWFEVETISDCPFGAWNPDSVTAE